MSSLIAVVVGAVAARQAGQRYEVGLVAVDGRDVLADTVLPAPAGEAESVALAELQVHAHELFRGASVELLVVWSVDPPPGGRVALKPSLIVGRAEGAVLAAAGQLGIERVERVAGATVRAAGGGGTDDAVAALCARCNRAPADSASKRALAAAQTWLARSKP